MLEEIPVLYINLATAPGRRLLMEKQLSDLGLTFSRVEAVTPDEIEAHDRATYCNPELFHWVHPAELACTLSHVRAWEELGRMGAPYGIILEDDAVLSTRLPAFLSAWQLHHLSPELIRLETSLHSIRANPKPTVTFPEIALHEVYGPVGGSAAYIISSRLASIMAAERYYWFKPLDTAIFDIDRRRTRAPRFLQAVPGLALQANKLANQSEAEASSIGPAYAIRTASRPTSPLRGWWYVLRTWVRRELMSGPKNVWLDLTGRGRMPIDFLP